MMKLLLKKRNYLFNKYTGAPENHLDLLSIILFIIIISVIFPSFRLEALRPYYLVTSIIFTVITLIFENYNTNHQYDKCLSRSRCGIIAALIWFITGPM